MAVTYNLPTDLSTVTLTQMVTDLEAGNVTEFVVDTVWFRQNQWDSKREAVNGLCALAYYKQVPVVTRFGILPRIYPSHFTFEYGDNSLVENYARQNNITL